MHHNKMAESFDSGNSVAGSVAGSVADYSCIDPAISLSLEDSADSADSVCGGLYEVCTGNGR